MSGIATLEAMFKAAEKAGLNIVEHQFQGFMMRIFPEVKALPAEQVQEMRNAFYAGMVSYQGLMFISLDDDLGNEPSEEELERASRLFDAVRNTVEEHADALLARALASAKTEGGKH